MDDKPEIALKCIADIKARIETIDLVKTRTFWVYSEADLVSSAQLYKKPAVGIMYEGLRSANRDHQGIACDLGVAIVVVAENKDIANLDRKESVVQVLDQIRNAIKLSTSPSAHKWRFVLEAPGVVLAANILYIQRWATPVMIS